LETPEDDYPGWVIRRLMIRLSETNNRHNLSACKVSYWCRQIWLCRKKKPICFV